MGLSALERGRVFALVLALGCALSSSMSGLGPSA
jgi:hypothetical protein